MVDNIAYVAAKDGSLVALDATTGKELWVYKFRRRRTIQRHRGPTRSELLGKQRPLRSAHLGHLVRNAARHRRADRQAGGFVRRSRQARSEDRHRPRDAVPLASRTPGRIFENLIILGSATGEGYLAPPGDIRAFDVLTGKLVWVFHTIPRPGEFGYETWPKNAYKYMGGVDVWGEITVDEKRGIVYLPTASAKYELYGGDRPGDNLYADCLLALDARTGKTAVAFPDRASRSLGLRSRRRSATGDRKA